MEYPVGSFLMGQAEGGNGMTAERSAGFQVLKELIADIFPDIFLRFFSRAADMRRQDDVGQALKGGSEAITVLLWLPGVYVDGCPGEPSFLDAFGKRIQVDDLTPGVIQQDR